MPDRPVSKPATAHACPHCGQALSAPPPAKRRPTFVQLLGADARAALSDADLHAYYKRVSAFEDITFWLANALLDQDERAALHDVRQVVGTRGGTHTPETRATFARLKAEHWSRRQARERAAGELQLNSSGPSRTTDAPVEYAECRCEVCCLREQAKQKPAHRIRREGAAHIVQPVDTRA